MFQNTFSLGIHRGKMETSSATNYTILGRISAPEALRLCCSVVKEEAYEQPVTCRSVGAENVISTE
jgi:hypothetical protein